MSISSSSFKRFSSSKPLQRSIQFKDISFYKFFKIGSTKGPPGKLFIFLKAYLKLIARYSILLISVAKFKQFIKIL